MQFSDKIVTAIPINDIQFDTGIDTYKRMSDLTKADIKDILRHGSVQFVIANVGDKLKSIDINECFGFWKKEVEKHLVDSTDEIDLNCYPDNYAYIASVWTGQTSNQIVLLEKVH